MVGEYLWITKCQILMPGDKNFFEEGSNQY